MKKRSKTLRVLQTKISYIEEIYFFIKDLKRCNFEKSFQHYNPEKCFLKWSLSKIFLQILRV